MKKISTARWMEVYKNANNEVQINWNDLNLIVKKTINYEEQSAFVNEVVDVCFGNDGEYLPENLGFAFRLSAIMRYSNLTVPTEGEKAYLLVYGTDAYDVVYENINIAQLDAIREAIEEKIAYILETRASQIVSAIEEIRSSVNGVMEKISKTVESVGDLDGEQIKNFMESVGEIGKLDEAKLVDAIMKQKENGKAV